MSSMKKERLEMFTDGVVAIIITLMIIEIKLPELNSENFLLLVRHIGVYAMSFIVIAIMWLNHHFMFVGAERINTRIIWLNFMLLFFMSLIPLPTKALGENFFLKESHLFYGLILSASASSFSLLQREVNKTIKHLSEDDKRNINRLNWTSTSIYALSIPLSFISIYLSTFIFILIPLIYFLPSKKLLTDN